MSDQMPYRKLPSSGVSISALGYGCMRFPRVGVSVDEAKAERLITTALDCGINYFDTAFIYPGSERALGRTLSRMHARERVLIATKMPTMLVKNRRDMDSTIEKQLDHLHTDYVDFYLAHTLTSFADFERLVEKGFNEFIEDERGRGRIRSAGFSFHGNVHEFKRIVDVYPWDMCMIQYNYIDEHFQAGLEGLRYASSKGLGVIAMEPLRGGLLGNVFSNEVRKQFDEYMAVADADPSATISRTPAELALRWVWKHPEVTCAISGMNEVAYIKENAQTAYAINTAAATQAGETPSSTATTQAGETPSYAAATQAGVTPSAATPTKNSPATATNADISAMPEGLAHFTNSEQNAVDAIKNYYNANLRVKCSSCSYCMPCPYGVDIPTCFYWYNNYSMKKTLLSNIRYILSTEGAINNRPSKASLCNACGTCERKCPQGIEIRENLRAAAKMLEKNWLRLPVKMILNFISNQ
ncbi:MAG: aldo/keto reductase [Oscillospiraceae bacterium]|nr:aldo/keto reductase [Oscillospiraceae bacterium]